MPAYEFFCRTCEKPFAQTMHVDEHDRDVPPCPQCGKKEPVEKRISSFTAVTSRKSAAY